MRRTTDLTGITLPRSRCLVRETYDSAENRWLRLYGANIRCTLQCASKGEWEFPQELDSARTKLSRRSVPVVWANCIARDAGLERTVAIKVLASQV